MVKVISRREAKQGRKKAADALKAARQEKTQKVLWSLEAGSIENQAAELARETNLPYVDLHIFPIEQNHIFLIPEEDALRLGIALFQRKGREVRFAVLNPRSISALEYIRDFCAEHDWESHLYVASTASLSRAWGIYKQPSIIDYLDALKVNLTGDDLRKFEESFGNLLNLKNNIAKIPTTEVLQIIMAGAIRFDASDIHFEPEEDHTIRIRYRVDGVLQDIGNIPQHVFPLLLSRVKMMGKMKLNLRNIAQDGRFSVDIDQRRFDIRVSIIPGHYGESIVMRLLDQDSLDLQFEDLGLEGLAYEQLQRSIAKPNGCILTTGPTGSGKTTMLYAILSKLNRPETKIVTIEDPIEYQMKGVTQTEVSKDKAYTFARGLRSIVRQDPDIILVGEIRDDETADIAVNASLTGHLVLSTLHTNSAAGSIPRLVEMGIKPTLIAPAVNAFVAQRLVRRLCEHCKTAYQPADETVDALKEILSLVSPKSGISVPTEIAELYKSAGCEKCHNTGYSGRIGIFEVLTITQEIEQLIVDLASENDITKTALEGGMITMIQDGILKAVRGITSLDEVWRVTGKGEFLKEIYDELMEQTLSRSFHVRKAATDAARARVRSTEPVAFEDRSGIAMLQAVFASAVELNAGDIHIEPVADKVNIRFRMDGILQTVATIALNEYPQLLGEIKLLSALKFEVRAGIKDSRFSVRFDEPLPGSDVKRIDIRVSIILSGYGETVVMRLLNQGAVALDVHQIGLRDENLAHLLTAAKRPNGLILNTGPTGSGKTTTLYSVLEHINSPGLKIITVEDPIEYQLNGILQTQVNEAEGYTFANALRALLRQNPDIIMVGEIRDDETAQIALQAALTGHLVISSLHTNNAAGAIPRLLMFGIRPDDIVNAADMFMAQRLVRRLCEHCKKEQPLGADDQATLEKALATVPKKYRKLIPKKYKTYGPTGCSECSGVGYKGRIPVSETLVFDKEIKLMAARGALALEIEEAAVKDGMITMLHDGALRVVEGSTSWDEVARVVEIDSYSDEPGESAAGTDTPEMPETPEES